jgi:SsrA-binding protein
MKEEAGKNARTEVSKTIVRNKKAHFDYQIMEKFEAGLVLVGTEVKSLRLGKAKIAESYLSIDRFGEAWIHNLNINQYEFGNINNHAETRKRKVLMHKKEIKQLQVKIKTGGLTLIPLALYFKGPLVKIEVGLAKGKKNYDKREDEKKKEAQRTISEQMKKSF